MYLIIFILLFIYFLPSITALVMKRSELSQIVLINLFLGWSILFWVVSFRHAIGLDSIEKNDNAQQ